MAATLTRTSSPIQISAFVSETAGSTFTSEQIDLTLNALDQEVFVVTQVNMDVDAPDALQGTTSQTSASISTTARATVGTIGAANVLATARREIISNPLFNEAGVPFDREDPLFAAISEDYLGIVATNNMFLNIQGLNNTNAKFCAVRVYGYRAKASASVYAALVQSELLSA